MFNIRNLFLTTLVALGLTAFYGFAKDKQFILGSILSKLLESHHYGQYKVDDTISRRAFEQLIKRLDYRKQFFLASDIKNFKKFETKLDDHFLKGDLSSMELIYNTLNQRIQQSQQYAEDFLKKPFNYKLQEKLETDYEKRDFAPSEAQRKDFWRKVLKYAVMVEVYNLDQKQQDELASAKKEQKKDKKKKLPQLKSFAQLESEARQEVKKDFKAFFKRLVEDDTNERISQFANAITSSYDPHSTYMAPDVIEDFNINMSGQLEGIGAVLSTDGPYTKVERIVPGSPSWKQKDLAPGDVILKVGQGQGEPESIVGMDLKDAVKLIRGTKGTTVKLTVRKIDKSTQVIPIVRDVVELEEGFAKGVILKHDKIQKKTFAYLNLPSFYRDFNSRSGRNCTEDVKKLLETFTAQKVDGLIFDLRNNGGGSLPDAVDVAGLFFKEGPVVQVKDYRSQIKMLRDTDSSVSFDKPVVLLQNSFSASASEIVAGALKDYDRALIVGSEHSHGKGTVQTVINLDEAVPRYLISSIFKGASGNSDSFGALKLTIQKFYRVNGSSTQSKGVQPHIALPDTAELMETGERYLDYAMPWDRVPQAKFNKWESSLNTTKLRRKSKKRVSRDEKFDRIKSNIAYLKKMKDDSHKSLNYQIYTAEREQEKGKLEEFKIDKINASIDFASPIFDSLRENNTGIKEKDKKRFTEAAQAKAKEFKEKLQKDPYLNEALWILNDMTPTPADPS